MTRPAVSVVAPPPSIGRLSGVPAEPTERQGICVLGAPESLEPLTLALANIGYRALAYPVQAGAPAPSPRAYAAAVITDSIANPLAYAAEMAARCPVLLVTSELSVEARLAAARAGVDAILARPLDVTELADWLNELIGPRRETPISVLVIDDDEILAESYALALLNAGMDATVETDPVAALGQMTATYPDLVLMDMRMPSVSGIELARVIRQSRRYLSLPIVFLSAERDPELRLEARRLGGDDFIAKPVDLEQLVSLVRMRANRAITLRSMMERDSLTGLLNHGRFIERLYHELERCRRSGAEVSLALIDLDRFKNINDTYGHLAGDRVLRTLAHTLSAGLRRIDVVGRYGGEEFGVVLLDTPPDVGGIVIDKIRRRFSEIAFAAETHAFSVTFSAGVAGGQRHLSPEELIAAADACMYRAKAAGRNRTLAEPDR